MGKATTTSERPTPLPPKTPFSGCSEQMTVLDYWQWSAWNLLDNLQRGVLAEFLVARALGVADEPRDEWAGWDLKHLDKKIEVKSAAYAQAWPQKKKCYPIRWDIAPRKWAWDSKDGQTEKLDPPGRTAHIYVFSLLSRPDERDQHDPEHFEPESLDLRHWKFHLLDKEAMDRKWPSQKSIGLEPLTDFIEDSAHGKANVEFDDLKAAMNDLVEEMH